MKIIFWILLPLVLNGCASLSKQQCQQGNWEIIGHNDGATGKAYQYLNQHSKACSEFGISPDVAAYQRGRMQGLKNYCIESKGFDIGKNINDFNDVCPIESRSQFIKGYQRGLEQAMIDIESDTLDKNNQLVNKALEVSRLKGTMDKTLRNSLKSLESDVRELQSKKRKIRQLQKKY